MHALARILICGVGILLAAPIAAETQSTPARAAILVDLSSGAVLLEKNADQPRPPASMSKLMTLFMVFEALEAGRISLTDEFRISERASRMGGSRMFIRIGEVISVENLLRGVVIQSGNDAAVALAEALSGTEEAFADLMNQRAADLGLTNSHFANATGWPDPEQFMSMRDLARLAEAIVTRFPENYKRFSQTEFTWSDITQKNRNPLLYLGMGADGLKTGHTEEAGYSLTASAKRGDRRVVLVVSGLESSRARRQEAERLINWAFRAFDTRTLFEAGERVADADVWIGSEESVVLVPERDVILTAPYGMIEQASVEIKYRGPIEAPIAQGDEIGQVEISVPEMPMQTVPLVAAEAVDRGGLLSRLKAAAQLLQNRVLSLVDG
ncbi:MAG: D-alanyl-D-alanine carboxypeptidase family protein [Pseudomonadota bacterium]